MLVYLDDIISYSSNEDEHMLHPTIVLDMVHDVSCMPTIEVQGCHR